SNSVMSTPSTAIRPAVGSWSRASNFTSVVLPAPLAPTIAVDVPTGSVSASDSNTGDDEPAYVKPTPSKRTSRRMVGGTGRAGSSARPGSGVISTRSTSSRSGSAPNANSNAHSLVSMVAICMVINTTGTSVATVARLTSPDRAASAKTQNVTPYTTNTPA